MIIIGNVGKKNTSNNTYFYTSQVRVTLQKATLLETYLKRTAK